MTKPKFSIITPSYNRAHTLPTAISSVLAQDFQSYEMIIVDDGSTDNTEKVVAEFVDPRIKYFKKQNEERGAARNYGIKQSHGEYICFLDSDDAYLTNHLSKAQAYIEQHGDCDFFYQPYEIEHSAGLIMRQKGFAGMTVSDIANHNILCPIGAFIKKEHLVNHPFDEDPKFNIAEDLYIWLLIAIRYGIKMNMVYTTRLINHSERTMSAPDPERLIYCCDKLITLLEQDQEFSKHPKLIAKVLASHESLIALYYSMAKDRSSSWKYFKKSVLTNPSSIFRKRTIIILRNLMF